MEQAEFSRYNQSENAAVRKMVRQSTSKLIASLIQRFGTQYTADIEASVHTAFDQMRESLKEKKASSEEVFASSLGDLLESTFGYTGDGHGNVGPEDVRVGTGSEALDNLFLLDLCCYRPLSGREAILLCANLAAGFSQAEISDGLGFQEEVVTLTIQNGLNRIRVDGPPSRPPGVHQLPALTDRALKVLRRLFHQAYFSPQGYPELSSEICEASIELVSRLVEAGRSPIEQHVAAGHACLAEMYFLLSRTSARFDEHGALVKIQNQDRAQWDESMIASGERHLKTSLKSISPDTHSVYHHLAQIEFLHTSAPSYQETDWVKQLSHYQALLQLENDPDWLRQRAICLAEAEGPDAGLAELASIPHGANQYVWPEAIGTLFAQNGDFSHARDYFQHAHRLVPPGAVKSYLENRILHCVQSPGV